MKRALLLAFILAAAVVNAQDYSSRSGGGSSSVTTLTTPGLVGSLSFTAVEPPPLAPILNSVDPGGVCTVGTHVFAMTAVGPGGESLPSPITAPIACTSNTKVSLILFMGLPPTATSWNLYASKAGTTSPLFQFTTVVLYSDRVKDFNVADGSLGAVQPPTSAPTPVEMMRWSQTPGHLTDAIAPTGLTLFPGFGGVFGDDITLTISPKKYTDILFVGNASGTSFHGIGVGYMCLGTDYVTNGCAKGQWNQSGLSILANKQYTWCPNTTQDDGCTKDTGLGRGAPGIVRVTQGFTTNGGGLMVGDTAANAPQPACAVGTRGTFWAIYSGAGVKDSVQVCAKDAGDVYNWRTIY